MNFFHTLKISVKWAIACGHFARQLGSCVVYFAGKTAKPEYSMAILGLCLIWGKRAKSLLVQRHNWDPRASPAQRVAWGKEEQRSERTPAWLVTTKSLFFNVSFCMCDRASH